MGESGFFHILVTKGTPFSREKILHGVAKQGRPNLVAWREEAFHLPSAEYPSSWNVLLAGELGAIFNRKNDGIELLGLFDLAKHRQFLTRTSPPLFTIMLRGAESKEEVLLQADAGWEQVHIGSPDTAKKTEICWQTPKDRRLQSLRVTAVAFLDSAVGAIQWKLRVDNVPKKWIVCRTTFPQIKLDVSSPQTHVFYPDGCGRVEPGSMAVKYKFSGLYPNGWAAMQFMAVYNTQTGTGLYCAVHDPQGNIKEIKAEGHAADQSVVMSFDVPAENMDAEGNGFILPGEAVWQIFHGDWFDAAMIYRAWVRQRATWYPKIGPDGRPDTPIWMRELPVWVRMAGSPKTVKPAVEAFAKTMGVPIGFHWYDWHQIPFDNDYPHYFPAKSGFSDAVRSFQSKAVYVMPYINGRLWDTRDNGLTDFEFSRVALPAVAKDENDKPYIESYGSKETDGSDVRLGVMCPAAALWRTTVRKAVLRLMNEYGVKGVYIDQVAAAQPVLCFDHSHGHLTGGGSWWTASYRALLDTIRQAMPADRMLTTECNAEPYVKSFDGYLTWHWCRNAQVPAFPAVYGGAIQMFGRAYHGDETNELALRMKAGQQFVFGEQIGWFGPDVIENKQNATFLKRVVGMRWLLRRYFYGGEMARPPKFQGSMPTVCTDWYGNSPGWVTRVTTDAVMTGAWRLPNEHRCVLLFTNVSDQSVIGKFTLDVAAYGLTNKQVKLTTITPTGLGEVSLSPAAVEHELTFPMKSVVALELAPSEQ